MLILARRIGESIIINGTTKVKIQSVKGGQIKLAIDAPSDVSVMREELVLPPGNTLDNLAS